ncbi:MAG TPA: hypothetical protein VKT73_12955 [Xanthobacteraceae bacterium]|nr:hypothetical protein [Xanthobacteraceae bacterium]
MRKAIIIGSSLIVMAGGTMLTQLADSEPAKVIATPAKRIEITSCKTTRFDLQRELPQVILPGDKIIILNRDELHTYVEAADSVQRAPLATSGAVLVRPSKPIAAVLVRFAGDCVLDLVRVPWNEHVLAIGAAKPEA